MRLLILAFVSVGVAAGCAGDEGSITVPYGRDVDWELRQLQATASGPHYFLGRRFERLPLTAVDFTPARPGRATFLYGTCTIPLPADGGCGVPVSVQSFPFPTKRWKRAVGCVRVPPLRGVPTVRWGDSLILLTRHGTITIHARTVAQGRRAVSTLRAVGSGAGSGKPLPPPPANQVRLMELGCGVV